MIDTGHRTGQKLRAVVFDMDGVLIHSAPSHKAAFEEVLQPFGITDFDYSRFAGWRTRDVFERVLSDAGCIVSPDIIAAASAEKSRIARELLADSDPVAPGCVDVLNRLGRTFVLALASSGSRESVQAFLDTTGTRPSFRCVLTGGDVQHAKPDPEIYTRTFAFLEVDPPDGLVVEDAVAGVKAARLAGASVIGISGTCREEDLLAAGALKVIQELRELPDWVEKTYEQ